MKKFEEICKDYYPLIFRYILGNVQNKEHAQDLTQDVFLIAYKKGKEFENHEKPEAFLYVTAKNLVLAHFRNLKRETPIEIDEEIPSNEGDVFKQLCKAHENNIEYESYKNKALQNLSEKDLMLYNMYYTEHIPMNEIATIMGLNDVAIRMRYVRLRKKIKDIVSDFNLGQF